MRHRMPLFGLILLSTGCVEVSDKGLETDDTASAVPPVCTTDADGWVSCDQTTWDEQLPAPDALASIGEDDCAEPWNTSYSGLICAAAPLLTHKAETFGTADPDLSVADQTDFELLQHYWTSFNDDGDAAPPTGDCPDTLREDSVFEFLWCNQPADDVDANLSLAMNLVQYCRGTLAAADRPGLGIWLGVELRNEDTTNNPGGDDLWFAVLWSMRTFHTASVLRYSHEPGPQNTGSPLMTVAIYGLKVRAEWSAAQADDLGLSEARIVEKLNLFLEDPADKSPPDGLDVRLRFLRVDFAEPYGGVSSWPDSMPLPILRSHGDVESDPWHMSYSESDKPLAIIDPVTGVDFDASAFDTAADTGGSADALGTIAVKDGEELSGLIGFAEGARAQDWTVVFGE